MEQGVEVNLKKRKGSDSFAERKARQRNNVMTVIKTGLAKFCRDERIYNYIQDCVWRTSLIACEASILASFHVLRLLEQRSALSVLNDKFFCHCLAAIANIATPGQASRNKNVELKTSLIEYVKLHPVNYAPTARLLGTVKMFNYTAIQMRVNFEVIMETTFKSRLA